MVILTQKDVFTFLTLIKPFLRFKSDQADLGLKILKLRNNITCQKDLVELAKLADSLSVLKDIRLGPGGNDGSKYTNLVKEYFNL